MKLPDVLEFIAVGFQADRFKTLMSSLGIIIGVMAIVVMLSVGEGLYSGVSSQFSSLNLDVIRVMPGSFSFGGGGPPGARSPQEPAKFADKDAKALENIVGVKNVAPQTSANVVIRFRDKNASASLMGIDPEKEDGYQGQDRTRSVPHGLGLQINRHWQRSLGGSLPHEDNTREQDKAVLSGSLHGLQGGRHTAGAAADLLWRTGKQPKRPDVRDSPRHEGAAGTRRITITALFR